MPALTKPNTAKTPGFYSWKELAKHNKAQDAWIAFDGEVYNVTEWIPKHPGGKDVVLWAAGRDATQLLETYHGNMDKVRLVLKKYKIGTLTDNELPIFPVRGQFFQTVKKRLNDYFHETKQDPKFHPMMLVRYALVYSTVFSMYYLQYYVPLVRDFWPLQLVCAVVMGFACAQVGLLPLHDASHCSITRSPWVWRVLGASHDFINGCSYLNWCYQHMLGHHLYTNVAEADPDITTNDPDFRRIKPSQKWYQRYVKQEYFVPLMYGLLAAKTRLQDVTLLYFLKMNDHIRVNPISVWHNTVFWSGKAFFIFYRFVLPLALTPVTLSQLFVTFMVQDLVASYWLAFTFQANHVVEGVEWPIANEKNEIDMDWAVMQVVTAQDYAHQSWFWTNFAGALNYQVVHHLFPNISQHYYPEIVPIIKDTCKEFGINYLIKDTYMEALKAHLDHLKVLGLGPGVEKKII